MTRIPMKHHLIGAAVLLLLFPHISATLKADIALPQPPPQTANKPAAGETAEIATTTDGGQYDVLRFAGRDMISGKLISLQPDKFLLWSHPDAGKNIEFKYANLREISLSGKHPNPPAGTANIRLVIQHQNIFPFAFFHARIDQPGKIEGERSINAPEFVRVLRCVFLHHTTEFFSRAIVVQYDDFIVGIICFLQNRVQCCFQQSSLIFGGDDYGYHVA